MSVEKPPSTIEPVQYLRAIAALMVVFSHANNQLAATSLGYTPELGHFGVDLFFVISGFIMLVITERRKPGASDFLLSRFLRIAPVYWFYTTLVAALAIAAPFVFRGTEFTLSHYLQSLFFIAHENPAEPGSSSPLLKLGWTLNYEMFFYLVFTLAIAVSFRLRMAIASVVLGILIVLGWLTAPADPVAAFYTRDIMVEFLFGMGVGWLYVNGRLPRVPAMWLIPYAALCLLWTNATAGWGIVDSSWRGLGWGAPAAGLLVMALCLKPFRGRPGAALRGLGDASYTIYLFHLFPLSGLRLIWIRIGLPTQGAGSTYVFVILAMVIVSVSGYLAYLAIEKPTIRLARVVRERRSAGNRKRPIDAAP